MSSTRISYHINAPRAIVYRALLDPDAIARWKVPNGMTCHVHTFDAREGGAFRISLTFDAPTRTGKTTAHTDTYHGHFLKLVPDEEVVESDPPGIALLGAGTASMDFETSVKLTAEPQGRTVRREGQGQSKTGSEPGGTVTYQCRPNSVC